jgi:type IV fimbrial biogenesis protein FimT
VLFQFKPMTSQQMELPCSRADSSVMVLLRHVSISVHGAAQGTFMGLLLPRSRMAGFTLVELMAVLAIIGILFAIGVPSYRSVRAAARVSTEVNGLLMDLQFARSEALKQGLNVTACVSPGGAACGSSTSWQTGWIIFSDSNGNATVDSGETVLRVQKSLPSGDTVAVTLKSITFNRDGFALNLPNAGVLLTLHDSSSSKAATRCLAIAVSGMMTTQSNASAPSTCI